MKTLAVLAAVLFLFLSHPARASASHGYIVKFRKSVNIENLNLLSDLGIKIKSRIAQLKMVHTDINPLELNLTVADRIALMTIIEYVEPNFTAHKLETVESEIRNLKNYELVKAPAAWEVTTGSRDIVVAVSDTGIWEHPDLKDNVWFNSGEMGLDSKGKDKRKNKVDDDGNGYVDDYRGWDFIGKGGNNTTDSMYHGTHVSGTIGAVGGNNLGMVGMAWAVRLMAVKFIDRDGSGTYLGGINTLIYAADQGARVINCSWGGDEYSQALKDAIEYVKMKNVLIIAAAGNDGVDTDKKPMYPAAYDSENIVSVASVYDSKGSLSSFSNYGIKSVDIAAPGEGIWSTFNPTYSTIHTVFFEYLSGTSMASPHVSGAAALALSANPNLKWNELKDLILSTGQKLPKLKGKILSESLLDAGTLVQEAKKMNSLN